MIPGPQRDHTAFDISPGVVLQTVQEVRENVEYKLKGSNEEDLTGEGQSLDSYD